MGEWDAIQLRDANGGGSVVFNPPDFAVMLSKDAQIAYTPIAASDSRLTVTQPGSQTTDSRLPGMQPGTQPSDQTRPAQPTDKPPQPTLTDAQLQAAVHNGQLELKYGDPNLDQYLQRAQYQTIDIQVPQGVTVKHWVDQNGNFFWFQGGNDNGARHYYPATAKAMTVNGQTLDLEAQRLKVDEAYAQQAGGFQSFNASTNPVNYFSKMSQLSAQALQTLDNSLSSSVKTSNNPYFKIYLADVYTAEAMQPIVQQVLHGGSASFNNPQTLQKLDQAIALTQQAVTDSRTGLGKTNQNPPGNVLMPLDPYEIYSNPNNPQFYYGFWGGSLQQAQSRETALTTIRNLISSNALPKIELPPALPPG